MPTSPKLWLDIHNLRFDIFASRTHGRITVEFSDRFPIEDPIAHASQVADGLAHLFNFRALGAHWTKLSRGDAIQVLITCLHHDLALHRSVTQAAEAQKLMERILGLFPAETVFLSNVGSDIRLDNHLLWQPLTNSPYNA